MKCAICREPFRALHSKHKVCGKPECAEAYAAKIERKAIKAKALADKRASAQERRTDRAKAEAMKTLPQLTKEAQAAFNAFIRARDRKAGYSCICCGEPLRWDVPGGAVDAGHYRSTGSAPNLRFDEHNCHAQRAICNRHGAGRAVDYRIGLIARIGIDLVEALESDQPPIKRTRDELRAIRDTYRIKTRNEGA